MDQALNGITVLLVEDDIFILVDLQAILETAGAQVVTASSVQEGLRAAGRPYNAALLDIRLSDGEVFPIAFKLKAQKTPLVFHSGNTETSDLHKLFPDAVALSKPAHEKVLVETIKQQAISLG